MGADLRAAFVASCLRGAFPPVDFLAVCLVLAISDAYDLMWMCDTRQFRKCLQLIKNRKTLIMYVGQIFVIYVFHLIQIDNRCEDFNYVLC